MEIKTPLLEAPPWLDGLVFSTQDGNIRIDVLKDNKTSYGYALISPIKFNQLADILLTADKEF